MHEKDVWNMLENKSPFWPKTPQNGALGVPFNMGLAASFHINISLNIVRTGCPA